MREDRHTIFHLDPSSYRQGPNKYNCSNWHLKVENKKCNIALMKNYCITVSMQKINSIHKLIQQILGSQELHDHAHFRPCPPKII